MHDLGMKWNLALPRQKQHSTRRLLDQKLGVKFKEETSEVLNLYHSFVWCGKLDSSEIRSELLRTFWNVVLQKDRGDQLDWWFKEWRCITKNRGEEEHPTHNKTKEAQLDKAPIHDTKPTKCTQFFFFDVYVSISQNISECFDSQGIVFKESFHSNIA